MTILSLATIFCPLGGANPSHISVEFGTALEKEIVVVPPCVGAAMDPGKAVKVELASKAHHLALLGKVLGENLVDESLHVVNTKGASMGMKRGNVGLAVSFDLLEHTVELLGKRLGNTAPGGLRLLSHFYWESSHVNVRVRLSAKVAPQDRQDSLGIFLLGLERLGRRGNGLWRLERRETRCRCDSSYNRKGVPELSVSEERQVGILLLLLSESLVLEKMLTKDCGPHVTQALPLGPDRI